MLGNSIKRPGSPIQKQISGDQKQVFVWKFPAPKAALCAACAGTLSSRAPRLTKLPCGFLHLPQCSAVIVFCWTRSKIWSSSQVIKTYAQSQQKCPPAVSEMVGIKLKDLFLLHPWNFLLEQPGNIIYKIFLIQFPLTPSLSLTLLARRFSSYNFKISNHQPSFQSCSSATLLLARILHRWV